MLFLICLCSRSMAVGGAIVWLLAWARYCVAALNSNNRRQSKRQEPQHLPDCFPAPIGYPPHSERRQSCRQ